MAACVCSGAGVQAKPAQQRIAEGQVLQEDGHTPMEGAVVYLENPKTLDIKSYLTQADGRFHFNQLAPQTDYDLWAEKNGQQSKHKFISLFSRHNRFEYTLELDDKSSKKKFDLF